jgi:hypothetical protein
LHVGVPLPLAEWMQHPPSWQTLSWQHGSPAPPHALHVSVYVPEVQTVLAAVQVKFAQHVSSSPPQEPHAPAEQVPPFAQAAPEVTQ